MSLDLVGNGLGEGQFGVLGGFILQELGFCLGVRR